jgi:hypothetical protein
MDFYSSSPTSSDTSIKSYEFSAPLTPWTWFKKFIKLDTVLDHLFGSLELNPTPRLNYKRDRQGEFYFEIYNPTTGQCLTFDSKEDVLEWFERQPSQQSEPDYFSDLPRR